MQVFLVRHGENPANLKRQFSHRHVDYSLTTLGQAQAAATAAFFARHATPIAQIYTSPLLRARETAEAIASACAAPLEVLEELRELNVGDLEHGASTPEDWQFHNEIIRRWLTGDPDAAFPAGEDYHTLQARMHRVLELVWQRQSSPVVLVGHGGIFGATLPTYCQVSDLRSLWRNPNCSISEFELHQAAPPQATLRSWATSAHLDALGVAADLLPE